MINETLLFREPGQPPQSLQIHIEDPLIQRSPDGPTWRCRVEMPRFIDAVDVQGRSPLQAISRALRLVRDQLTEISRRGTLSSPDGDEVGLEALFGE